jgi:hypothetical protein
MLVHKAESLPDLAVRSLALELVRAVMEFHGLALGRIVGIVSSEGTAEAMERLLNDDLISSALVLHGVHPGGVAARVERAMDKLARYFDSRGGRIELLDLDSERLHVRYSGKHGSAELREMIEDAICEAAPEITSVFVEGIEEKRDTGFVPLTVLTGVSV